MSFNNILAYIICGYFLLSLSACMLCGMSTGWRKSHSGRWR